MAMNKHYVEDIETLEVGNNNMSDHLAWLFRIIIFLTVNKDNNAVNSVVYSKNLPRSVSEKVKLGVWGKYYAATRSIVVNLSQHINSVMDHIQDEQYMHNSVRVLLLRELLDTCVHEAWHAKACADAGDWTEDDLDENGAKDRAFDLSWGIAELWDVNVEQFGPIFDVFLQDLYKDLKEDVQEADCKEWKKVQLHMLENNINYYNPETGMEVRTIREVFEAQVGPEIPWMDTDNSLFTTFTPFKTIAQRITEEEPTNTDTTTKTAVVVAPVAPIAPVVQETVLETLATVIMSETLPEGYDPLSDSACNMGNPFADDEETPVMTAGHTAAPIMDNTAVSPVVPAVVAPTAPAVDGSVTLDQPAQPVIDVLKIQQIAEMVLRRMFHHVNTKCEFNTNGGFNNTQAVLDPINISDIEGATELFAKQDTLDANGVFTSRADINGFIKGLPTAGGLPRYTFYMNMGGTLHKRVFIAQNPEKKKADGVTPTPFAAKVQAGNRIMMLLADGAGITADITLPAGQILGQETFKIWDKK